jgi:hypothetical protein
MATRVHITARNVREGGPIGAAAQGLQLPVVVIMIEEIVLQLLHTGQIVRRARQDGPADQHGDGEAHVRRICPGCKGMIEPCLSSEGWERHLLPPTSPARPQES